MGRWVSCPSSIPFRIQFQILEPRSSCASDALPHAVATCVPHYARHGRMKMQGSSGSMSKPGISCAIQVPGVMVIREDWMGCALTKRVELGDAFIIHTHFDLAPSFGSCGGADRRTGTQFSTASSWMRRGSIRHADRLGTGVCAYAVGRAGVCRAAWMDGEMRAGESTLVQRVIGQLIYTHVPSAPIPTGLCRRSQGGGD